MTVTFGTPKAKPGGFPKPALKGALIVYLLSDYDEKAPSKWDPTSPKASVAYCIVVDSNAADQQVAPAGTAFEKVTWRGVLAAQAALVEVGEHVAERFRFRWRMRRQRGANLARLHLAGDRPALDSLDVLSDPIDQCIAVRAELVGRHGVTVGPSGDSPRPVRLGCRGCTRCTPNEVRETGSSPMSVG